MFSAKSILRARQLVANNCYQSKRMLNIFPGHIALPPRTPVSNGTKLLHMAFMTFVFLSYPSYIMVNMKHWVAYADEDEEDD